MSEMSCWDILGITPTEDKSAIKQAYAKILKDYHPEDDPIGFQRIRDAYTEARQLADSSWLFTSETETSSFDNSVHEQQAKPHNNSADTMAWVLEEANKIYGSYEKRICIANWQELLECELFWDLESKDKLLIRFTDFIHTHPNIPHEILILLNNYLHWTESMDVLYENFDSTYIDSLLEYLEHGMPFIYPDQETLYGGADLYISKLSAIYLAIRSASPSDAIPLMSSAKSDGGYGDDPNILLMRG